MTPLFLPTIALAPSLPNPMTFWCQSILPGRSRDGTKNSRGACSLNVNVSREVDCNGPNDGRGGGKPSQPPVLSVRHRGSSPGQPLRCGVSTASPACHSASSSRHPSLSFVQVTHSEVVCDSVYGHACLARAWHERNKQHGLSNVWVFRVARSSP